MIYIHIPFCKSFCTYCGFYSETADCHDRCTDAILEEIRLRRDELSGTAEVNTLYIGGGTPSVLPLSALERLVGALKDAAPFEEFTVEMNPEDVVERGEPYAEALLKAGVTRASMGVQSFDDRILRWMNRRHDSETAVKAYRILERAGFRNISIDLIFGLPRLCAGDSGRVMSCCGPQTETARSIPAQPLLTETLWRETLRKALEISGTGALPSHISAYQLSVEPDSALEEMIAGGRCTEAEEETCAAQYEILCGELASAGYRHYEISNFALPGCEARHNSAYWRHVPYAGFGPGAHSLERLPDGRLRRSWNVPDLHRYIESLSAGDLVQLRGSEILTPEQVGIENVMLGLRTAAGCALSELENVCVREALAEEVAAGRLVRLDGCETSGQEGAGLRLPGDGVCAAPRYRIPEKCFFISDSIISSLLG